MKTLNCQAKSAKVVGSLNYRRNGCINLLGSQRLFAINDSLPQKLEQLKLGIERLWLVW